MEYTVIVDSGEDLTISVDGGPVLKNSQISIQEDALVLKRVTQNYPEFHEVTITDGQLNGIVLQPGVIYRVAGPPDRYYMTDGSGLLGGAVSIGSSVSAQLPKYESYEATVTGFQTKVLPVTPAVLGHSLFVNGLQQPPGSYSITGTLLTIPSNIEVVAGDIVTLSYY